MCLRYQPGLVISPDLDGYRTPKMKHLPCKTQKLGGLGQNRSRTPITKLQHCTRGMFHSMFVVLSGLGQSQDTKK